MSRRGEREGSLKVTFVDSSVLITAARGDSRNSLDALAILDDPERTFASSTFVRLKALPRSPSSGERTKASSSRASDSRIHGPLMKIVKEVFLCRASVLSFRAQPASSRYDNSAEFSFVEALDVSMEGVADNNKAASL